MAVIRFVHALEALPLKATSTALGWKNSAVDSLVSEVGISNIEIAPPSYAPPFKDMLDFAINRRISDSDLFQEDFTNRNEVPEPQPPNPPDIPERTKSMLVAVEFEGGY